MEQYIKIKAIDEDNNLFGTFKLSIDYNGFINLPTDSLNKEIPLGNLILYNVPIVESFDNRTPIQYYKNSNFNANVMLLEEHKYTVEFESEDSDLDVFYSLKNTKNSASECFKYPFNHKFGTVTFTEKNNDKIEEKTYLIDTTYRQFFTSIRCNEGRYYTKEENTNKIANPDPGYFIEDISFAKELITNGYIELTKENSIKYGKPFYLSSLSMNKLNNKTNIDYYKNIITSTEKYTISRDEIEEFNYNYLNNLITNKRKK